MSYFEEDKISAEIICAVATPKGTSALSVIRISGKGSVGLIERIMSLKKGRLKGMRRKVGTLIDSNAVVDEVVAISWPERKSFTGEEMVEITCHGIPSITREIMEILIREGARRAEPGEFTRRAYTNGRINAFQVIELAALWNVERKEKVHLGEIEKNCRVVLAEIEKARETVEGNIEFGEEHPDGEKIDVSGTLKKLIEKIDELAKRACNLEKSTRVMIMGPTNSGKSTLFNLLTGRKRALVSEEPGTTREGLTSTVEIGGRRILICDTAGNNGSGLDRAASDTVIQELDGSERVIWMSVGGKVSPDETIKEKVSEIIEIEAKSDISEVKGKKSRLRVSSFSGEGLEELKEILGSYPGSTSIADTVKRIKEEVIETGKYIKTGDYDLAAEILSDAEREIREILGKGDNILLSIERALSGMCIGK